MVSAIGNLITSSCQFISRTLSSSRFVQQPAAATKVAMNQLALSAKDLSKTVDKKFVFKSIGHDPAARALVFSVFGLATALIGIAILSRCCRGERLHRLPQRRYEPSTPGPTYTYPTPARTQTVYTTPVPTYIPEPAYIPTYTTPVPTYTRTTPQSTQLPTTTRQGEPLHRLPSGSVRGTHDTGMRMTPQSGSSRTYRSTEDLQALPTHRGVTHSPGPVPNNGMRMTPRGY